VSSAGDKSDQSHFGPGGADITVAVVRRSVGDSMAFRAIHGARSAVARSAQSDGTHLRLARLLGRLVVMARGKKGAKIQGLEFMPRRWAHRADMMGTLQN
jgi:hypothetical protein